MGARKHRRNAVLTHSLLWALGTCSRKPWGPLEAEADHAHWQTYLGLATASCAFARELWHFYLLFGILVPIGTAFCGAPILNPALLNWFGSRRGLAIGLGQIGGGLSFAYGMLIESLISQLSWRPTYLIMAGIIARLPATIRFLASEADLGGMGSSGNISLMEIFILKDLITII